MSSSLKRELIMDQSFRPWDGSQRVLIQYEVHPRPA